MAQIQLSPAAQQVWEAIEALHRNSPAEQHSAGKWLNEFAEENVAPEVSLELLQVSHPTEVQFFSANMLLTTIKRRWSRFEATLKQKVQHKLTLELDRRMGVQSGSWMVLQRIVLAFATVCAFSGPGALPAAVGQAIRIANQGNVLVAAELLGSLADVAADLHRLQRAEAVAALITQAPQVFPVVRHLLKDRTGGNPQRLAALRCLLSWLKPGQSISSGDSLTSGTSLMSPGTFRSSQVRFLQSLRGGRLDCPLTSNRELFDLVLEHVGHPDEDVAAAATESVVVLMESLASNDPEEEEAALRDTAAAVLRLGNSTETPPDSLLHNAAQIAAALANRDMQAIADRIPEAVPLAAVVLRALGCGHHGAAKAAIEYLDWLSSVPVAERHPQLGQPVFISMLPHLLELASYPAGFTTWEESPDGDSNTFHSFRDNVLSDGLNVCHALLKQQSLDFCGRSLQSAATWQAAEAALFALRQYLQRSASLAYSSEAPREMDTFLEGLFGYIVSPSSRLREHPYCMDSAGQFIASNSVWVGSAPQPLYEAVVGFALAALQLQPCAQSAATALHFICSAVPDGRASPLFAALLPAVMPLLHSTGPGAAAWEAREEVVKGMASLIGIARLGKEAAGAAAQQLALPFAQHAEALALQTSGSVPEAVAGELGLLAASVDRMEFLHCAGATAEQHPAAVVAVAALPHLERISVAPMAREATDVTCALCRVFKHSLQVLGPAGEPLLKRIVPLLGGIFPGDPKACIKVLTAAVDLSAQWPASQASLGDTVRQLAGAIAPSLQASDPNPDLAAAWFSLLAHCLIDDPSQKRRDLVLKVAEVIPQHFALAVTLLEREEDDLVRSLISFLRSSLGLDVVNSANTAKVCIRSHGEALLRRILVAIAMHCPHQLQRSLASLLHGLLNHAAYGRAVRSWVATCMADDPNLCEELENEVRQKICQLMLEMAPTTAGQFGALMKDMASIARREATADVLLSYEL